jgi:hypothetical protein
MDLKSLNLQLKVIESYIWERLPVLDKGADNAAVFLAGSARSGTTWITDILNYDNSYRIMFEPFHPQYNYQAKKLFHRYFRANYNDSHALQIIETILLGRIQNKWVNRENRKLFSNKRLIKSIRSNLFLKWMNVNFPTLPIILLLRHPCAVALSRMKFGWKPKLDRFLSQEELVEDYLSPFLPLIKKQKTEFEEQILSWCVENFVPLCQFKPEQIKIVFYENMCVQPEEEIARLFKFIGTSYNNKVFKVIKNPSATSHAQSAVISHKNLVGGYKKLLDRNELSKAETILRYFGLDRIYGSGPMPKMTGKKCLEIFHK